MTARIQASIPCWNLEHRACSGEGVNCPCQCECHELRARITELQAANTREVERRREAEREVANAAVIEGVLRRELVALMEVQG